MDVLAEIRRVIDLEVRMIDALKPVLGPAYEEAVRWIFDCRGQVVVTGVGKSGVIAQKIAATMVSTGTPAVFLHGADGLHGGIGIVKKDDIVLAVGKSGESEELLAMLPVARKIGARVISITAQPRSSMARHSDLVLHTPIEEEACPLNMAPTCSTTVALVVGDALAVTLMKLRGFRSDDFAVNHPGGQLGKRLLLTVGDLMRSGEDNPVVHVAKDVRFMLTEMTRQRAGAVSIIEDEHRLLGLVTDYDVRRVLEAQKDVFALAIQDIMNAAPEFVYEDDNAYAALEKMEKRTKPISVLPVLNQETQVVGMIHLHDLIARGL
ncbi:MAG: KpsF/GutQ family sugar-phosphate isomerase [Nitrospira sp. SB0677_bin_15]|nr:KpsF/GutQ family sugar-phosphate isomerase [Nitrospira sp. SB0667_bin_9]MYD31763.1 KpsF/GutQ family sugar-phosphate isomerase [Nitrospira sp. SB0661_bin_20]MYG39394.1 KpsF/GutQ family sugar-phosphate isomerase [Nitrospira sp. SB0677_bin_15]MYH01642.1 KpsF/GutQ family sugar-phosphate isomerase [Nitrospira sp. SB0675_bin_23]